MGAEALRHASVASCDTAGCVCWEVDVESILAETNNPDMQKHGDACVSVCILWCLVEHPTTYRTSNTTVKLTLLTCLASIGPSSNTLRKPARPLGSLLYEAKAQVPYLLCLEPPGQPAKVLMAVSASASMRRAAVSGEMRPGHRHQCDTYRPRDRGNN